MNQVRYITDLMELVNNNAKSRSEYNNNKRELFLEFVGKRDFRQSYYKMLHSNLNSVNNITGWKSTLELLNYYPTGQLFKKDNQVLNDMQLEIVKFLNTSQPINPILTIIIRLLFFPSDYIRQYVVWTLDNHVRITSYLSNSGIQNSTGGLRQLLDFHTSNLKIQQTFNIESDKLLTGGAVHTIPKILLTLKKVGVSRLSPRLTKLLTSLRTKVPLSLKKLSSNIAQKEILDSADKYKKKSKRKHRKKK